MTKIGEAEYFTNKYGMLQQKNPGKFDYSKSYLGQQSTNLEMSYLRLGYLLGFVSYETLRDSKVLELGPGTGQFFEVVKKYAKSVDGYDVATSPYSTITDKELHMKEWDIVCGFDVLEHFSNIDDLWKMKFRIGYFSSPCPPEKGLFPEWRHLKPNEHLVFFNPEQFHKWANAHGYDVLGCGYPEDLLRKRWDENQVNINSFIIRKKNA